MTAQEPHEIVTRRWANQTYVGFDLETTGTDVNHDRIVTATLLRCNPGMPPIERTWIIDPGIPIPTEASDVHGWTTERIAAFPGRFTPPKALAEIGQILDTTLSYRTPVVAFNAAFDFTFLERELARHNLPSLGAVISHGHGIAPVIDPRVLDKQMDPYRKAICQCGCGATDKTLAGLCKHYGVELTEEQAHTSAGDALAAVRLVPAIVARYPGRFSGYTVEGLHEAQIVWWRAAQLSFARWNREKNNSAYTDIRPEWPVIPPEPPVAPPTTEQGAIL